MSEDKLPAVGSAFSPEWLTDVIDSEKCAFLCGAGASVLSGLPTANQFIEYLIGSLMKAAHVRDYSVQLRQRLEQQRLEYVLQIATQTPGVNVTACLQSFGGGKPNIVHVSVIRCLSASEVAPGALLTTNFECLFEEAARLLGAAPVAVLTAPGLGAPPPDRTILVKLHGSIDTASDSLHHRLAATLDTVGRHFSDQDVSVLDELLRDRTLIVLGYSGNDHYDVIPYLYRHKYRRVIWVQHDNKVSGGMFLRDHPPPLLRILCGMPGSMYVRADTPSAIKATADYLKRATSFPVAASPSMDKISAVETPTANPIPEPLTQRRWFARLWPRAKGASMRQGAAGSTSGLAGDWRPALDRWVSSLGPRAALVLGDLLLREDEFGEAVRLYRLGLRELTNKDDTDARVKARRNIGTALVLSGNDLEGIQELGRAIEEEKSASPEQKSALIMEFALAQADPFAALWNLSAALEFAKAGGSEFQIALINRNIGKHFLQRAIAEDRGDHLDTAIEALYTAKEIFVRRNSLERLEATAFDLADCHILRDEFKLAVLYYTFAAWYSRITAYRDDGARLRLMLGYVISAGGLGEFMGTSINELYNLQILASLGAVEIVIQCTREVFLGHLNHPWKNAGTRLELLRHIKQQASELAKGPLKEWQYSI